MIKTRSFICFLKFTTLMGCFLSFKAESATIKQLVIGEGTAAVLLSDEEKDQTFQYLLATVDGKQCRLPVLLKQGTLLKVSTKECPFRDKLAVGQTVEAPLFNEPAPAVVEAPASEPKVEQPKPNLQDRPPVREANSDFKREITDLSFLPPQGRTYFQTTYTTGQVDMEVTQGSSKVSDTHISEQTADMTLAYGVSDKFVIGLTQPILISRERDVTYGAGSTLNGQKINRIDDGFGDATLGFLYRGIEQSSLSKMNLDFRFGYLTSFQKSRSATADEKGNAARGGDGYDTSVSLFRKSDEASFKITLGYVTLNTRTNETGTVTSKTTGGNMTYIGLSTQLELGRSGAVEGFLQQYTIAGSEDKSDTSLTSTEGYSYSKFGVTAKLIVVPEASFVQFGIAHVGSYSASLKSGTSTIDASVDPYQELSAGLNFLF